MKTRSAIPKTSRKRDTAIPDLSAILRELEVHCGERNRQALKEGIRYLLREFPSTPRLLTRSFDWYWRAGMQKEALQLAYQSGEFSERMRSPMALGNSTGLWFMLLLASQSGWLWVERWLKTLPRITSGRDLTLLSRVLSLMQSYEPALKLLESEFEKITDTRERRNDSYMMLSHVCTKLPDQSKKGLKYARAWEKSTIATDRFLKWQSQLMCLLFEGRLGQPSQSLGAFDEIQNQEPEAKIRAPRIFRQILIWRAELEALAGDKRAARVSLETADDLTCQLPDYAPFRRVDIYCDAYRLGISTREEEEVLAQYPSLLHWQSQVARPLRTDPATSSKRPEKGWVIYPVAQEYFHNGKAFFGIPLEIQLLGYIRAAGTIGIHRYHLMALLWSEQWMILPQLEDRLTKLIKRLRETYKISILADKECLTLKPKSEDPIALDFSPQIPHFLTEISRNSSGAVPFSWEDVARTYSLGATQSREVIHTWMEKGWIEKVGSGRNTRYCLAPRVNAPEISSEQS